MKYDADIQELLDDEDFTNLALWRRKHAKNSKPSVARCGIFADMQSIQWGVLLSNMMMIATVVYSKF